MKFHVKNETLEATFDTLGAELLSLKSSEREYIWEGNPDFWSKHSPILFPIVGALKNDTYFFEGQEFQLPRHGFAREKEFTVVQKSENNIIFSLKDDAETIEVYPFYFELQIEYLLLESKLEVHYRVKNNSENKLYFSIGGHPAFKLSSHFEDHALLFQTDEDLRFSLLENNLLGEETQTLETIDNKLPLNYKLFEKDALVFKNQKVQSIMILEKGKKLLKVHLEQFPELGIWTKTDAPFICIEPWFGHADEVKTTQILNEKAGIQILEKNGVFKADYAIEVLLLKQI